MRCASGIAYVPEDRKTDGLFPDLSVTRQCHRRVARQSGAARHLFARRERAGRALGDRRRSASRRRTRRVPSAQLSGGNQQKTLLARWLETDPEILIVDEPTRGVDVAAKHEIHAMLARLAEAGAGILVISSDLIELIALADRIVVMHAGRIAGELDAAAASEEAIMALASGLGSARAGRAA